MCSGLLLLEGNCHTWKSTWVMQCVKLDIYVKLFVCKYDRAQSYTTLSSVYSAS